MDKLPVLFHPDARLDALTAHEWYAERSVNAADAFQDALIEAGRAISENPAMWPTYILGTRRYLLKRFPFVVVYRENANRIEVIAVAHGHRRPGYWAQRLDDSK